MPLSLSIHGSMLAAVLCVVPPTLVAQASRSTAVEDSIYVAALARSRSAPWPIAMSPVVATYDSATARRLICMGSPCTDPDTALVQRFVAVAGEARTVPRSVQAAIGSAVWLPPDSLPPHGRRLGRLPDVGPRDAADSGMVRAWETLWRRPGGVTDVMELSRVGISADGLRATFVTVTRGGPEWPSLPTVWRLDRVGGQWHVTGTATMRE